MGMDPLLYLHFSEDVCASSKFAYGLTPHLGNELQDIPVNKECLKNTLGVMELPVQKCPGLDLVLSCCWPMTQAGNTGYHTRN